MSLIPNTVCTRCHRQFPSFRSRCPYCGTKKPREVRRAVPESDSAVKRTEASRRAAEDVNWQMLIGGILLLLIIAAVITLVSVSVQGRISDTKTVEDTLPNIAPETTAVPAPTATPTPTPEPTAPVTSVIITFLGAEEPGFAESVGSVVDLDATAYPINEDVTIEWRSSNEEIATVDQDGVVTLVGTGSCVIYAKAGGYEAKCDVWSY